jgi:hypothetical protein
MPNVWSVEVRFATTEQEAQRWLPPTVGTLEPLADGVLLRCQVEDLEQTALHLLQLPCPLVVRQPPELLETLRRLAGRCREIADRSAGQQHRQLQRPRQQPGHLEHLPLSRVHLAPTAKSNTRAECCPGRGR